jgi:ATP-dependent DNA helicase RecG
VLILIPLFFVLPSGLSLPSGFSSSKIISWCKEWELPEPEFDYKGNSLMVRFRKDIYTEENLKNIGLNERQIKALMYVKERGKITNKEYQEITGISRQMATIDLKQLVRKGILVKTGKAGAGIAYQLTKLTNQ